MFMLSFIFVIVHLYVVLLSLCKSVQFLLLFVCICIVVVDPIIRGRIGIPFTGLTLSQFYACPKPWPGFLKPHVLVFFMFNGLRQEVVVRFIDIGVIVDHHCLNFLVITKHYQNS